MNIGASVVIKGNIAASEDFSIAGCVEGEVRLHAGMLMLAPGCHVAGEITAPSIVVGGNVDGNLAATERLEVCPGAVVAGSITTPSLLVADGAQLNCRVEMSKADKPQAAPAPAAPRLAVAV